MLSLSKNVAHDYDPNLAFSTHNANMPHMSSWIDDLVKMTEKSLPTRSEPTTTQLVEALQRYDAVFKEIIRQNVIYSEPLSKMISKAWIGSLSLMDYMIKSYHKYVRHTTHLQDQARELLEERQNQIAASKIQLEEFELQKTIMRAKSRNLEAEVLALEATKRGQEREIAQLRTIISVYIQSKELSASCWNLMDAHKKGEFSNENTGGMSSNRENFDAARDQLHSMSRLEVEMNEALANVLKEEDLQRMLVADLIALIDKNEANFSAAIKTWTKPVKQKKIAKVDKQIQVDESEKYGTVTDLIESPRDFNPDNPPEIPHDFKVEGIAIPFQIRKFMKSFPRCLRILPLANVLQTILMIYINKVRSDDELTKNNIPVLSLGEYVYEYYLKTLGVQSVVDVQIVQFLTACAYHSSAHKRVELFCFQLGIHNTEYHPELDVRDTTFIISIIRGLLEIGELEAEKAPRGVTATIVFQSSVLRSSGIEICQILFKKWLQDGGEDCVNKLKSIQGTEKGAKYIDVDELINILFDLWCSVRIIWEDHLQYLFNKYCSTYRVLGDVVFATDVLGTPKDRDVMLVNIQKSLSIDCSRRPMRMIQRPALSTKSDYPNVGNIRSKTKRFRVGNVNKEAVCDAVTKDEFITVINLINPKLTQQEIESIFGFACEFAFEMISRTLDRMWTRCWDDKLKRHFYVNKISNFAQWTRPFHQKSFRTREIEEDVFISTILKFDILATGPFVELLHNQPSDLWPNSEMFLKQHETRIKRAQEKEEEDAMQAGGSTTITTTGANKIANRKSKFRKSVKKSRIVAKFMNKPPVLNTDDTNSDIKNAVDSTVSELVDNYSDVQEEGSYMSVTDDGENSLSASIDPGDSDEAFPTTNESEK